MYVAGVASVGGDRQIITAKYRADGSGTVWVRLYAISNDDLDPSRIALPDSRVRVSNRPMLGRIRGCFRVPGFSTEL